MSAERSRQRTRDDTPFSGGVTALLYKNGQGLGAERVCGSERPFHSDFGSLPRYPAALAHDGEGPGSVVYLVGPVPQGAHRTFDLSRNADGLAVELLWIIEQRLDRRGPIAGEDECYGRKERQVQRRRGSALQCAWHVQRSLKGCLDLLGVLELHAA